MNRSTLWIAGGMVGIAGIVAFIYLIAAHFRGPPLPPPDFHLVLRHPNQEPHLTELDLVNRGGPGTIDVTVDVDWGDADLEDAKALSGFDYSETGRRSARFTSQQSMFAQTIAAGAQIGVGWIRLTDDSPLHTEMTARH